MDENTNTTQETPAEQPATPVITQEPTPTVAPAEESTTPDAGHPDGTVLGNEKVVYDKDEQGNVVGWHKEVV